MSDGFSLNDALSGQDQQTQGQNLNNPWGSQNPGQQGFPGQQYPGAPGQGQQYPGAPGQGQQYPGAPGQGQQYPGAPGQGQQYPGFPGPGQGQNPQYPGFPGAGQGQQYPGGPQNPGFPAGGQQYPGGFPGYPVPGQPYPGQGPTDPKQTVPSAPSGPKKLPFEIPLSSGCTRGMLLTIIGVPNGKRFNIDFKAGRDIALHINPRFDESPKVVVRNSIIRGEWGSEERACAKFPFVQGQQFKLQALLEADSYKVAVNNEQLCQYQHRHRDFSGITCITINGDLTLNDATITTM